MIFRRLKKFVLVNEKYVSNVFLTFHFIRQFSLENLTTYIMVIHEGYTVPKFFTSEFQHLQRINIVEIVKQVIAPSLRSFLKYNIQFLKRNIPGRTSNRYVDSFNHNAISSHYVQPQ